jgi:hypothetical protein
MKILTVPRFSGRIREPYTESVNGLRITPFFSVNGRLRACLFDRVARKLFVRENGARSEGVFASLISTWDAFRAVQIVLLVDTKYLCNGI